MPMMSYLSVCGLRLQEWQFYTLIGVAVITIAIAVLIILDIRRL